MPGAGWARAVDRAARGAPPSKNDTPAVLGRAQRSGPLGGVASGPQNLGAPESGPSGNLQHATQAHVLVSSARLGRWARRAVRALARDQNSD